MKVIKTVIEGVNKDGSEYTQITYEEDIRAKKPTEAARVLDYITKTYNLKEFAIINQARVKEALNMKQQAISRAMQRLIEYEILIEGKKVDKSRYYKLTAKSIQAMEKEIKAKQSKSNKTEPIEDQ